MIPRYSIEAAYSFFHQKWNVYSHSALGWQRDDIEYAIAEYAGQMNPGLYAALSDGDTGFLKSHSTFAHDIRQSLIRLEAML